MGRVGHPPAAIWLAARAPEGGSDVSSAPAPGSHRTSPSEGGLGEPYPGVGAAARGHTARVTAAARPPVVTIEHDGDVLLMAADHVAGRNAWDLQPLVYPA